VSLEGRNTARSGALNWFAHGGHRLVGAREGTDAAPRAVTVPPPTDAELIARQLSDRDPVVRGSTAGAQVLAPSLLD
jgi:hypothetical protein